MQNHVLGHHAPLQSAFEPEPHGFGNLQEQLAGAEHKTRIGVADTGGELAERAGHARMRVGAEQDFTGAGMPFRRQGGVAHAGKTAPVLPLELALARVERPMAIRVIDHVVEILQFLFADEIAEDIHVAVRFGVGGENVVVGDDNDLFPVPDPGVFPELALEHANGPRTAHIMRHQNVHVDPDVVARLYRFLARRPGHEFFRKCHVFSSETR